jgi:hypothetical protein
MAVLLIASLGFLVPLRTMGQAPAHSKRAGQGSERPGMEYWEGGIIRGSTSSRRPAIVFTGHDYVKKHEMEYDEARLWD